MELQNKFVKMKTEPKSMSVKKQEYISQLKDLALKLNSKYTKSKNASDVSTYIHVISMVVTLFFEAKKKMKSNDVDISTDETIDMIVELLHPVVDQLLAFDCISQEKHDEISSDLDTLDDMSGIIASVIDVVHGASLIFIKSSFWKRNCICL
jgi:predicted house-cleaning noncanonical NTP pyrophosphatase (MazG superfamily)